MKGPNMKTILLIGGIFILVLTAVLAFTTSASAYTIQHLIFLLGLESVGVAACFSSFLLIP